MTCLLTIRLLQRNYARTILCNSNSYLSTLKNGAAVSSFSTFHGIGNFHGSNSILEVASKNPSINLDIVRKSTSGTDHSKHNYTAQWTAEKALAAVLLGSIPAAIAIPSPSLEYFLAFSLMLHAHWGVEAIVVDYIRPSIFGPMISKLSVAAIYTLSAVALGGLFYFIYTDVGLINAVKLLWKV